jgi:O-antigen/teichoic acid export membrane protein
MLYKDPQLNLLKRNIIANFGGSLWIGLMGIIFVPIYINLMGIEAYGLIGVYTALLAFFGLLDMGLSSTLNREMARMSVQGNNAQEMRDLVRTLEIPYWAMGLLIGIIVIALAPVIAYRWVNSVSLPHKTVQTAVMIMGLVAAFQWPISFYSGGLMGLQRQVLLNGINTIMATFRGIGAVLILWLVSPAVEAYFIWQMIASLIHVVLTALFLRKSLPLAACSSRFRGELLLNIWRFAAGMTGISVMGTILMHLDKVILSRMLSLEMFGYYTLASAIAMTLYRFVSPVFSAIYPRLTNLVTLGTTEEIILLYHKSAQLMSVIILPAAVIIAFFSEEILLLWTRNPETAEQTHLLVSIFITGTAINGVLNIPYALQLAFGYTRLGILVNLFSVLTLIPLMIILTKLYGVTGSASVWIILNAGYILIALPVMHQRLLPAEKWRWYFNDVSVPLMASVLTAGAFRFFIRLPASYFIAISILLTFTLFTLAVTAISTRTTRSWFMDRLSNLRFLYGTK